MIKLQNVYAIKIKNFLIQFLLAQLVITLVSMPILIHWGLPISKMSFIGNLIFLPILTIFLVISSLIFFTEILNIPNSFFIYLLNKTTYIWELLLKNGQKSWLTGFSKVSFIILLIIPILTFLIINNKNINTQLKKILSLGLLLIVFTTILRISNNYSQTNEISLYDKIFITKTKNNQIKIKDCGMFAKKQSVDKFVEFELKSEIIKNFGTLKVKTLSVKNAGLRVFKGIIACSKFFEIKKVKLPFFDKKLTPYGWKMFFEMKNELLKNNIKLIRN